MRVLFLHPMFPGPFGPLAKFLAANKENKVLFLSERSQRNIRIPQVRRLSLPGYKPEDSQSEKNPVQDTKSMLERASVGANALLRLRKEGFIPDIIYASATRGYSFYARDVYPESMFAVHAHWFHTKGENYTFFNKGEVRSPVDFAVARAHNLLQFNALGDCHLAVTTTEWQKKQYPESLASSMYVVPGGVDCNYFKATNIHYVPNNKVKFDKEVVTFFVRNRAVARGLPQFTECLQHLLQLRPACNVFMMLPSSDSAEISSCQLQISQLGALAKRVEYCTYTPANYYKLLTLSSVHVYLTAPFTLSSSIFEAMACGCLVLASDTSPVRELITHEKNGVLCDFWDTEAMAKRIAELLENLDDFYELRHAARRTIVEHYDAAKLTPLHAKLLEDTLASISS